MVGEEQTNKMKLFVAIYQMQDGGAGRVTCTMINGLVERGYEIVLCTDTKLHEVFYPLSSKVKVISYNNYKKKPGKLKFFSSAVANIRKLVKQEHPDVVIGVESIFYFISKVACVGLGYSIVAVDHTSMGRDQGRFINWIRHSYYKKADKLSLLTQKDANLAGESFHNKIVIYNPNSFDILQADTKRKKNILCVGRLNVWKIKGFDRILKIWAELAPEFPEWTLEIAGDGSIDALSIISNMIKENALDERVHLLGQIKDMQSLYQSTSIFALPSRVEGFPMCLIEAMSQGCACIAFDLQKAVCEIVDDQVSGTIVEDGNLEAFTKELRNLLESEELRIRYNKEARTKVAEFSVEAFCNKWEDLLRQL